MFLKLRTRSFLLFLAGGLVGVGLLAAPGLARPVEQKTKRPAPVRRAPGVPLKNYFPLQVGNSWVYRARIELVNEQGTITRSSTPRKITVVAREEQPTHQVIRLQQQDYHGKKQLTYLIRGKEIYEFDELDQLDEQLQAQPPSHKLRYVIPLRRGQRWGEPAALARQSRLHVYRVTGQEDITVPAGTFPGCFRIVVRTTSEELAQWFAPGIGIVKLSYQHNGSVHHELYELESYKLKKAVGD